MKPITFSFRQLLFLLVFIVFNASIHAQVADFQHRTVFNFYKGYLDNVIDTAGNILFTDGWDYLIPIPEHDKYFGIRMLADAEEGQLPEFDHVPAEYAILSPDGGRIVLDYLRIEGWWTGPPYPVLSPEGWGIIDIDNEWIMEPTEKYETSLATHFIILSGIYYDEVLGFSIGDWENLGFADLEGNILAEPQYTEIYPFDWWTDPYLVAMRGDSSSLFDRKGKEIIPMGPYYIFPSVTDESVWVVSDDSKMVYYPAEDRWIKENTDELMYGLYGCRSGFDLSDLQETHYYISWHCREGDIRIDADPGSIHQGFIHPYRRINEDGRFGVISKEGDTLLPCIYDNIYEEYMLDESENSVMHCVHEGFISVEMDGYWGLVDTAGNYHTHFVYNELQGVSEGMAAARIGEKTGFIDTEGNTIVPFVFDRIKKPWENGIGHAYLGEIQVLVNRNGRIIYSEVPESTPAHTSELAIDDLQPRSMEWLEYVRDEDGTLLTDMDFVEIYDCGLTSIPEELSLFTELADIQIVDNYISRTDYDFSRFKDLVSLVLADNRMKEFPKSVLDIRKLKQLDLSYNQIRTLPAEIQSMKNLEVLRLNDNHLEVLPEEITSLKSLVELDLRNNSLESVPEELLKHKKLQMLWIGGNAIPPDLIDRYMEIRPDIEFNGL